MKAILTTIGKDKPGIVAHVSTYLAKHKINILDISQTIMDDNFTMMMLIAIPESADFMTLSKDLKQMGQDFGLDINIRNEALYRTMHQL